MYKGIAGSEGIGIGKVVIIEDHDITIETKHVPETDSEIARLQEAIEKFVEITNKMADKMDETVGKKDADILRGHIQMLQDPMTVREVKVMRDQGKSEEYIRHWLMEMAKLQGK